MLSVFYTMVFYTLLAVIAISVVCTLMYDEASGIFYAVLDMLSGAHNGKWHK